MLEQLNQTLIEMMGPLGPVIAVGAVGLLLVLAALPTLLKKVRDPMDRLRDEVKQSGRGSAANSDVPEAQLRHKGGTDKLDKYAKFLEPEDKEQLAGMKLKLLQAGYKNKSAVRTFHFMQFFLALVFLFLGLIYAIFLASDDISTRNLIIAILAPAFAGYYLPKYWIERRRQERVEQIEAGFPDALDLMLVCVEAGQSLDQAIIRVSQEIRAGYPALADEFEIVAHEMKAGKDRIVVLKDMSERAGVPDVSSFVTVMIQSASFGTSIAEALRVYAAEMRDKRVMRAEEKANILPTKLTMGTMMFTVPPLMIILIGPSVVGIIENLGSGGL